MKSFVLIACFAVLAAAVQAASFTSSHGENIYYDTAVTTYENACKGTGGRLAMIYEADLAPASNLASHPAWIGGWNGDDYNHAVALVFTPSIKAITPSDPSSTLRALCVGEAPPTNDEDDDGEEEPDFRNYCLFSNRHCPGHWKFQNFLGLGFSRADLTLNPFFTTNERMPRPYDFNWVYPAVVCGESSEESRPKIRGLYSIAKKCPKYADEVGNTAVLINNDNLGAFSVAEIGVAETAEPGWTWVYFKMCHYAKYSNKRFRSSGGCVLSHTSTCPRGFSLIGRAGLAELSDSSGQEFEHGSPIEGNIRNGVFVHPYLCCGNTTPRRPL